jgi:hypothetical protein
VPLDTLIVKYARVRKLSACEAARLLSQLSVQTTDVSVRCGIRPGVPFANVVGTPLR